MSFDSSLKVRDQSLTRNITFSMILELLLHLGKNLLIISKIFINFTNFDLNLTSFLGGVPNYVSHVNS